MSKYVYFFGNGKAEGSSKMKDLLGGKGANVAEMTNLGIPVPPGFTISAEVCDLYYKNNNSYSDEVKQQVAANLDALERLMKKKLGDPNDPLLVSVRSGAAVSMPGMMDTVLNLGLNDKAVEGLAKITGNDRFAWDAYRRFIQMYGDVVKGVKHALFERALEGIKQENGFEEDTELNTEHLQSLVKRYKTIYKNETGEDFPQAPIDQLWGAIDAVFGSWNNDRAIKYRNINKIEGLLGTAVNVQSMVFGNFGDDSGTGVCFTRDPSTGENIFYGEYLMNAQGEDVVAGIRTPQTLDTLAQAAPDVYKALCDVRERLEDHYTDMQDMEFTIQQGNLFLLQTRTGKRTGAAAVKVAVDMVSEGVIDRETAVSRVSPDQLEQLLHPMINPAILHDLQPVAKGLNASPGAACGRIVFTAEDAEEWVKRGETVLLVRQETSPEDIGGMHVSQGILTATGGMTSHAAVVARGMGTPCVAGCGVLQIRGKTMKIAKTEHVFKEGDWLTIDGGSGAVYQGKVELIKPEISGNLTTILEWADDIRHKAEREVSGTKLSGFGVRTNADQPEDAIKAREYGAEGIGLCRTEHMFFSDIKLQHFQQMILAQDLPSREKALSDLMPLQKEDFVGIFRAMDGLPVTVRLLDPPLHEFLPHSRFQDIADILGVDIKFLQNRVTALHEHNPMLGHRGCRLAITYPEIYNMQVEAIVRAAIQVRGEGKTVEPEIMIPLVGTDEELIRLRANALAVIKRVSSELNVDFSCKIGTMIEVPRAALTADKIARHADFFSFGTNDLTQMTFGYSRDDSGAFLPAYVEQKVLKRDPFQTLDRDGVGQLVGLGIERGRYTQQDLKVGICGEHGGDPDSIDFCYGVGMNYVSCSPFRIPVARLAAAQAVIAAKK